MLDLTLPAKLLAWRFAELFNPLLIEQLKLLEDNLGRAVKEAFAEDIATLEVQGRFLSEKFAEAPHN